MRKQKQNSPQNLFLFPFERYNNIGFWVWDPHKDKIKVSENIHTLYNIENKKLPANLNSFLELINDKGKENLAAQLDTAVRDKQHFVYNETLSDRGNKNLKTLAMPLMNDSGKVEEIVMACMDVSIQKELEDEIKSSLDLNERLLENTNSMIILQDKNQKIIYANSNTIFASGAPNKSFIIGNTVEMYLDKNDGAEMNRHFEKVMKSGKPSDPK